MERVRMERSAKKRWPGRAEGTALRVRGQIRVSRTVRLLGRLERSVRSEALGMDVIAEGRDNALVRHVVIRLSVVIGPALQDPGLRSRRLGPGNSAELLAQLLAKARMLGGIAEVLLLIPSWHWVVMSAGPIAPQWGMI